MLYGSVLLKLCNEISVAIDKVFVGNKIKLLLQNLYVH